MNGPLPGQFYMLSIGNGYDPLLKRAFSLFRKTPDGLQILYRIKGRGTSLLAGMKQGSIVDMLGPLGNSYQTPPPGQVPLIVAGGIGIASVFSFAEKLHGKAFVFYGARKKDELFMLDKLRSCSRELIVSTDDGSEGKKGTIVGVLKDFLDRQGSSDLNFTLYACGAMPMLSAICKIAESKNIKGFVSLEEQMACGIGACLGCAVKANSQKKKTEGTDTDYKMICKEGPVFPIEEIVW